MKKNKRNRVGVSIVIIGAIVFMFAVFGAVVSLIGYVNFTNAFNEEYTVSTYHMANTAATLIKGDHLDEYLAGEEKEEYLQTEQYLDLYCKKISVSLIYLIRVDRSDYGSFVSIFNLVCNEVDDTSYTPWELGYERKTTNDEYRQKYKALYEENAPYETVYRTRTTDGQHPHITTMVPVKDSAGEVVGVLCMQRPVREINDASRSFMRKVALSTVILALISSLLAAAFIRNRFVTPIRKVAKETTRFARENTKGRELRGISRYRELADLAVSIDTMETDMVSYIENLTSVTAEKERIGAELNVASQIQADMLPRIFPPFPDRPEFDIYALMTPAKEVGGDFYDFFLIDDDHVGLVIADVSGKGIPAALFMVIAKTLIKNHAQNGECPAEILTHVNEQLCEGNEAELFVTVWLAVIEISTGRGIAANAGHEHPAIRRADGSYELVVYRHSPAVATLDNLRFREHEFEMRPGDSLFVYTDGVPEATNAKNEMFGTDRMLDALNSVLGADPKAHLDAVRRAIGSFAAGSPQFDDITMLGFSYYGAEMRKVDEQTFEATVGNLDMVLAFVDGRLEKIDCPMKTQMQIDVAVEELFVNIANYAYAPDTGPATVRFESLDGPRRVLITLIDGGIPYDPLAKPDPDVTLSADERPIGGLGIFMVKKTMDAVRYKRRNGKNEVTIEKKIGE